MPASPLNPNSSTPGQPRPADGTRQLLEWGTSMLGAGILAAVLLQTWLGGFSPTGARTNSGSGSHGMFGMQNIRYRKFAVYDRS